MFSKLFKKQDDGIDYSELVPYFKKNELDLFVYNQEFISKYKKHTYEINKFISEVRKFKKPVETVDIINKYIILLNEKEMDDNITLFLSKQEHLRRDFFRIFDKKYGYDKTEDIITREQNAQEAYKMNKTGNETFNNIPLDDLFDSLDVDTKEYLVQVLATPGAFDIIKQLFEERYHASFMYLLKLLSRAGIDGVLLDEQFLSYLGFEEYRELILTLSSNKNGEVTRYIKILINNQRFDLVKDMLEMNLMSDIITININNEELNDMTIIQSIENLKIKRLVNNQ